MRFVLCLALISAIAGPAHAAEAQNGCLVIAATGVADSETCSYVANGPGQVETIWIEGAYTIEVTRYRCYYGWGCSWDTVSSRSGCGFGPLGLIPPPNAPVDLLYSQANDRVTVTVAVDECFGSPTQGPGLIGLRVHDLA